MSYSADLIKEVKEVYPDDTTMHGLAEAGSVWLGRYLDDSSYNSISIENILEATSLEDLQAQATVLKRRRSLYIRWCSEDPRTIKT